VSWRDDPVATNAVADFGRLCGKAVEVARRAGTALGEEHSIVGALLEAAAGVERAVLALEAELDSRPGEFR
jgi:hypothetical protein